MHITINAYPLNEGGPAGENTVGFELTIFENNVGSRFVFRIGELPKLLRELQAISDDYREVVDRQNEADAHAAGYPNLISMQHESVEE